MTSLFRLVARRALDRAVEAGVALAILVDGSPTCGSSVIYDGSFTGRTVPGRGVATEELLRHGIPVFHEGRLAQAAAMLADLEKSEQHRLASANARRADNNGLPTFSEGTTRPGGPFAGCC